MSFMAFLIVKMRSECQMPVLYLVPGLLGPKSFRPGTPRPKSIFLLGLLGPGLLGPVIKILFVAYKGKQMYI